MKLLYLSKISTDPVSYHEKNNWILLKSYRRLFLYKVALRGGKTNCISSNYAVALNVQNGVVEK